MSEYLIKKAVDVYRAADEILTLRAENQRLRAALEYILEYWNRDENEHAMSDALWKIIAIAEEALSDTTEPERSERQ